MESRESRMFDFIVNNGIATKEEVELATSLCGWSMKTMWQVIGVRTALHNMWQLRSEGYVDIDFDLDED